MIARLAERVAALEAETTTADEPTLTELVAVLIALDLVTSGHRASDALMRFVDSVERRSRPLPEDPWIAEIELRQIAREDAEGVPSPDLVRTRRRDEFTWKGACETLARITGLRPDDIDAAWGAHVRAPLPGRRDTPT